MHPMRSPDRLRAEVSRLIIEAGRSGDASLRQRLAGQALELAQEAEAIASLPDDVEGLCVRIAQYRYMLEGSDSEPKQRVVAQLLRDAEDKLRQVNRQQPLPRHQRLAVA